MSIYSSSLTRLFMQSSDENGCKATIFVVKLTSILASINFLFNPLFLLTKLLNLDDANGKKIVLDVLFKFAS